MSFGIVLSPLVFGVKLLCVRLTRKGFTELEQFYIEALKQKENPKDFVVCRIHESASKFYCQVPFQVVPDACTVADLRGEKEVIGAQT